MPFTHKFTQTPNADLLLVTAIRRGMLEAGAYLLAQSDALAPKEDGEPKHGVHLVDTGYVQIEPGADVDVVWIGYAAFWSLYQEENLSYKHPNGQAKFLNTGVTAGSAVAVGIVQGSVNEAFAE